MWWRFNFHYQCRRVWMAGNLSARNRKDLPDDMNICLFSSFHFVQSIWDFLYWKKSVKHFLPFSQTYAKKKAFSLLFMQQVYLHVHWQSSIRWEKMEKISHKKVQNRNKMSQSVRVLTSNVPTEQRLASPWHWPRRRVRMQQPKTEASFLGTFWQKGSWKNPML